MKSLAFLVFLFLVVPGSGQLVWDGLPLSTRAELATLLVVVLAVFNRDIRRKVRDWFAGSRLRGAVKPALLLLALLKVLSFTWYPFGDGFDACYRSIYHPLENAEQCEKSYEGPLLIRDDIPFDNTSRIDRTVDFGVHMHDWSLPFMNEYPRLGALWLERFPFTVSYGAMIRNSSDETRILPIYGNGEISGIYGSQPFSTDDVPLVDRYEFPRLVLLEAPKGNAEFLLDYRYSDDDATETPDIAPPPRGPYARLKIGQLYDRTSLLERTRIRVRGWSLNTELGKTADYFVAVDATGIELGRSQPQERPDVARFVGHPELTKNGFNLSIPADVLTRGDVRIVSVYGERSSHVATLTASDGFVPELPSFQMVGNSGEQSSIDVWFDVDRNEIEALAPDQRFSTPVALSLLLLFLDAVSVLIFFGLLLAVVFVLSKSLIVATLLAAMTFGFLILNNEVLSRVVSARGIIPIAAVSLMVLLVLRFATPKSLTTLLPTAVVLAAYKSFDQLERFHGSKGERWWGRLHYYWRDSDWYATQGYARTVFLEGSLRGGEAIFWFQAGPRYLAFATRSLLGENDVLVGIIMTSLGFFAVLVLVARFLARSDDLLVWLAGAGTLFVALYFSADDLIAGFGFVGSSEYPTWIVLFVAASFVISNRSEARAWPMVAFAIALGYSVQLRPNQIGGIVLMFVVMLLLVDRSDKARAIGTASKMIVAFSALVLFSLLHNLYYGESFVPFTANAGINYQFSWLDVLGFNSGEDDRLGTWRTVLSQVRTMMYWNAPGNWSWAMMFWGSQLAWLVVIGYRFKKGVLLQARSLFLLIPFGYALPMLKYQMGSYFPRHLVAINLAFLLTALMAWPHDEAEHGERINGEPTRENSTKEAPTATNLVSATSR
jgi:hypothetical protein